MAIDLETKATRYRADCPTCGAHIVMKVRRPKANELDPITVETNWSCVICASAVKLQYPEGLVG